MTTPMTIPMMTPMTIPTIQMGPTELKRDDAGQFGDTAKSLDPYRSDEDLGDLDWRFSDDKGQFAMDEEVRCLNSRLVIMDPDNGAEHMLHGSRAELYLADNLRNLKHSFENADEVPNVQTNPVRLIHYPQGQDDFTDIREENLLQMVLWKTVHFALFLVKISINFSLGYSTVFFSSQCMSLLYNNFKILLQKFQNFCTMF
jgi:hypothetical protein